MIATFIRNKIKSYTVQNPGHVYFENFDVSCVTFFPVKKQNYFGKKVDGKFVENLEGKIVVKAWLELTKLFPEIRIGFYKVKENEFSGMITIDNSRTNDTSNKLLPIILSNFKSRSTKLLNQLHGTHGRIFWENQYKEFSIKDLNDLNIALQEIRTE